MQCNAVPGCALLFSAVQHSAMVTFLMPLLVSSKSIDHEVRCQRVRGRKRSILQVQRRFNLQISNNAMQIVLAVDAIDLKPPIAIAHNSEIRDRSLSPDTLKDTAGGRVELLAL